MPRSNSKPIIIESKTCHVCDYQNKILEKTGYKDKFRVMYVQNKNGQSILKKAQLSGHRVEGTPTFFCSDMSCKSEGAKGPKLLRSFLRDAKKSEKQKNLSKPVLDSGSHFGMTLLGVLTVGFLIIFLGYILLLPI